MMVNTTIVSSFTGDLPLDEGACRKIAGGPLYPATDVLRLIAELGDQSLVAWTNRCNRDMQKWSLDMDDVCQLIEAAVRSGKFRGAEWCVQSANGPWAACDAYSLVRSERIPNAGKEMSIEYYIKFAIARTGKLLLVASCHPSEDKR